VFRPGSLLRNVHAPAKRSVAQRAAFQPTSDLVIPLTSTSFDNGGIIPATYSGRRRGDNISPQLSWTGLPAQTQQLLLIMEDPDVPLPFPIIHLAALFAPSGDSGEIAEGELSAKSPRFQFIRWLIAKGYHGPLPFPYQGPHHYGFYLFALTKPITETKYRQLRHEIAGNIIARGVITGVQSYPNEF